MLNYNTNFYSLAILIAVSIYHLMIFFGRTGVRDERYNLYFALFALSFALEIFFWAVVINDHIINLVSKRVICPHCGSEMKIVAVIQDKSAINKIISHLEKKERRLKKCWSPKYLYSSLHINL